MNGNQPTVSSVALKYGLLTGLASVVYTLLLFLTDQTTDGAFGWVSYAILIIGIVLAYREFKSMNQGYMAYGQGLGIGTLIGAVTGVLSAVFLYVYVSFVDTAFLEKIRERQIIELERRDLTDEQIEQALAISEQFIGPGMMALIAIIGSLILGFLFSLVIAAIMRNSRPDFE
jgi:hypothetical protein